MPGADIGVVSATERALLTAILNQPQLFPVVRRKLTTQSFSEPLHARLWTALCALHGAGLRFSLENLERHQLERLWVLQVQSDITSDDFVALPGGGDVLAWAGDVVAAHERREVERLLVAASQRLDRQEDTASWLAEQLLALRREEEGDEAFEAALEAAIGDVIDNPHGLTTGLQALDLALNGFQAGNLVVIGGRPASGKTSLAMGVALHQALHLGLDVDFYSLEMTRAELALRSLCCLADISTGALRRRELDEKDWRHLERAAKKLATLPLRIDDTGAMSVPELTARARSGKAKAVYVDYLQLLSGSHRGDNRENELAQMSRSLKGLAKDCKAPVVVLSQLRRLPPGSKPQRPTMSDLKGSGAIEADADAVLLVWRKEAEGSDDPGDSGRAMVIVEKNRHGAPADVTLGFVGETTSFVNLETL